MYTIIIPARYASTRFMGKPLVEIKGLSMIQRTYQQASKTAAHQVIVATDDFRILEHVQGFGGNVMMTSEKHQSGTDRCAEIVQEKNIEGIVVNVQGDEPFIQPEQIDAVAAVLLENPFADIASLIKRIEKNDDVWNPNIVKAIFNDHYKAIYFSRHPIPYLRGVAHDQWAAQQTYYKHIGLYAYRADILGKLAMLPVGKLEKAESLEQLRWLEHGYKIVLKETFLETIGIDTPDDLQKINSLF